MFYANLYFGVIVWKWIFRQIGIISLGLAVAIYGVFHGMYWPVETIVGTGFMCWILGRGIKWLITRNEPPHYTVEQLAAHSRLISEMAKGNVWFDPRDVPIPPAASVKPVKPARIEPHF
jgi:hypothetical protein